MKRLTGGQVMERRISKVHPVQVCFLMDQRKQYNQDKYSFGTADLTLLYLGNQWTCTSLRYGVGVYMYIHIYKNIYIYIHNLHNTYTIIYTPDILCRVTDLKQATVEWLWIKELDGQGMSMAMDGTWVYSLFNKKDQHLCTHWILMGI